jgi:hypothetical protein
VHCLRENTAKQWRPARLQSMFIARRLRMLLVTRECYGLVAVVLFTLLRFSGKLRHAFIKVYMKKTLFFILYLLKYHTQRPLTVYITSINAKPVALIKRKSNIRSIENTRHCHCVGVIFFRLKNVSTLVV